MLKKGPKFAVREKDEDLFNARFQIILAIAGSKFQIFLDSAKIDISLVFASFNVLNDVEFHSSAASIFVCSARTAPSGPSLI